MSEREVKLAAQHRFILPKRGIRDTAAYHQQSQEMVRHDAVRKHPPQAFGIVYLRGDAARTGAPNA